MNKFIKITSIIAGGFFAVGLLFVTIGNIAGGRFFRSDYGSGEMSRLTQEINEGLSEFSDHFAHLQVTPFSVSFLNKKSKNSTAYEESFSFDADGITHLEIETGFGECEIRTHSGFERTIDVTTSGIGSVNCTAENGVFHFDEKNRNDIQLFGFGTMADTSTVTILVPREMELSSAILSLTAGDADVDGIKAEQVTIKVGAGQMQIDDVETAELTVEIGAGELDVGQIKTDSFRLDIGAGEICISKEANCKEAKLSLSAGDVLVHALTADMLSVNIGMGNITIEKLGAVHQLDASVSAGELQVFEAAGSERNYNYEMKVGAGEILVGDTHLSAVGGEKSVSNGAENTMKLNCGAGEIAVFFAE